MRKFSFSCHQLVGIVALLCSIAGICAAGIAIIIRILFPGDFIYGPISLGTIAKTLNIEVPTDYSFFVSDGSITRAGNTLLYFNMELIASPATIGTIVGRVCGGVLYANYDPFNAFYLNGETTKYPSQVIVRSWMRGFLSYSPAHLEPMTFGNVCVHDNNGNIRISLEQLETQEQVLRVQYSTGCCLKSDIRPTSNTPFLLRGDVYVFPKGMRIDSRSEVCIDLDPAQLHDNNNFAQLVLNRDVEVTVDNNSWPSAYISQDGIVLPKESPQDNSVGLEFDQNFNYCYTPLLSKGHHTMVIKVRSQNETLAEYSWIFETVLD
jgi:hypothetical protein